MVIAVSLVHVFVCLVLILVILLQAGKGGGLSDMFGGALTQNQKLFGAETNSFLTKATSYCAIIFIITCITLGVLTTRRSRSLLEGRRFLPQAMDFPAPVAPGTPAAAPAAFSKASVPAQASAPAAAAPAAPAPVTPQAAPPTASDAPDGQTPSK